MGIFITSATNQNADKVNTKDAEAATVQAKDIANTYYSLSIGYHFLATYLTFGLVLWLFFVGTRTSLISQGQIAAKFDAKLAVKDGLFIFTECLEARAPGRNATADDFVACLSDLSLLPNAKMGL